MANDKQQDYYAAPMDRDICCVNFAGLFAYLRRHHGERGVDQVVEGLVGNPSYLIADRLDSGRVIPLQKEHLNDPSVWISDEVSQQILTNVAQVVPGPHPLFTAGEGSVAETLSRTALMAVRLFGIGFAARQVASLNRRFNNTKTVTLVRMNKNSAVLRLDYHPGFSPGPAVCDWNRGIYSGVIKSTGARQVTVRETRCASQGGNSCLFEVHWKESGLFKRAKRAAMGRLFGEMAVEYERAMAERDYLIKVLGRSERRYHSLYDSAGEAIILIEGEVVLDCNPRTYELFGARREQIVGLTLPHFSPERQPDGSLSTARLREFMRAALAGRPQYFDWRLRRCNHEPIEAEVSLSRVEAGESELLQALVRDVTKRIEAERALKQVEQQLRQAQKMEAVGTLAGGIAHDFNNILAAISGYSELALAAARTGETSPREIGQVLKAVDRAKNLVQQILAFSRKAAHQPQPMNLNTMLREAVSMIKSTIPKMIAVELDLADDLRPINGDATQLEQVVLNLAGNARDAMPNGGVLRLRTENKTLGPEFAESHPGLSPGDYVLLTVEDTGVGMPPEVLSHVFEPFFTTKEIGKGTGMGLASAYGIVKGHGGYISCSSEPGKGASFAIHLPAVPHQDHLEGKAPEKLEAPPTGSETVLVVDDEVWLRDIAGRILRAAGYQVIMAPSGEQALEVVQPGGPHVDLVLLDIGMPGMGGLRCLEILRRRRPGLGVIIASGYSRDASINSTVALGAKTFVNKPFRKDQLLSAVRKVLDAEP